MVNSDTKYIKNQLLIPDKLYGRENDISTLLELFEHISSGHGQVLLVPGYSGVGKTALVHELQMPVNNRNGFFIRGKFDQYLQNIPYYALRQALTELCRELKSGNAQEGSRFKADILGSVGKLGQVLVDLAPEFESFIGKQPPLEEISPQEARHRIADVFRNFIKAICRPEHPMVIVIDDCQWADAASMELLRQMQVGITLRYVLVIVSYRDNEVKPGHLLMSTVDDMQSHNVPVKILQVKNVTPNDVQNILSHALIPSVQDIQGLASIIHVKTQGNPFFVRALLGFLHEFNLIWFDKGRNCWRWHLNKNDIAKLPHNVVELYILKFRNLDSDRRNLFSLAACLGNHFDMETLSIISGRSPGECLTLLLSDQVQGLFLSLENGEVKSTNNDFRAPQVFSFLHDRVQQAAYSLIASDELPLLRLKIGRLLLSRLSPEQLSERLFDVAGDLNAGFNLILDNAEQLKVVELNITAARKAYAAAAYRSALQFYRSADRFLENPGFTDYLWHNCYDLIMSLFKERAECEFLEGDRNEAEKCIQQAVIHSVTSLEKADALNILIVQYTLLARYTEAIEAGRLALDALGISLPVEGYDEVRNDEIALIRRELAGRLVSSLVELPVMSNQEMLMASKILITMGPPCYRYHQRLWSVIVPKVVNLTLRYGNIPQVGYSHTAFGGLLGWVDNDYTAAKEFGELATLLMTGTFRSPSSQSVFYLMIGSSIRHWFKPLRYASQDYSEAYAIGVQSGNLQYAAYAFGHNMYCRFYQGVPIDGLIKETQYSLKFSRNRMNQWAIDLLEGGLNLFIELSEENPSSFRDDDWLEEKFLQRVGDHHNIQVKCIYNVLKTFSLLLSENYGEALSLSDETEPIIYTVGTQGLLPWPEHVFVRMLILTSLYSTADQERQYIWRTELDRAMNNLRIWTSNCSENYEHKYLLAAAELARIDGDVIEAMQLYDKAIKAAQINNFMQWEGVANERAYSFWTERGNERIAHVYWQQAYVCYNRWGAAAKVKAMEAAFRRQLNENLAQTDDSVRQNSNQEQAIKNLFVERQIEQLRDYAFQMQQTKLRIEATTQAEELAQAMQRLRVEISERKKAIDALRSSELRFKTMFNEAPLGIALIDSLTGQIYSVNSMFAKIAGRTLEEMDHIDWISITHPDDLGKHTENIAMLNAGKISGFQTEKRYLHPDGTFVWINMTIAPIYAEDKAHPDHLCMIEDITGRKQTEEELKLKNKQLLKINTEKDKFFSIIAHDLRSPFSGFLGLTKIMAEELPNLTMAEIQEIAVCLENSATNLFSLLENLLHWARIQQGLIPFEPEEIQLNKIVSESMALMREPAINKGIVIESDISVGINVFADKNMLQTVFRNLFSNAVKFTTKGGKISISAKGNGDGNVEISIKDTGIGMNNDLLDKLFSLNEQANRKGTDGEPSTGLGLLLCKEFAEKNGGQIWVESEEGRGSTFYFTIPFTGKMID